jgi:hypothetical protein
MPAIKMYRGDSKSIAVKVRGKDEQPYDTTSMTLVLTVKDADADYGTTVLTEKSTDSADGVFTLSIAPTATEGLEPGSYWFDLELSNPDRSFVATLSKGQFVLLRDLTTGAP